MEPIDIVLFAVPLLWIGGWIVASILFRQSHDKPIFPSVPDDALYNERWGSGRSLTRFWARFGGANNCLLIAVTSDRLRVTPRFPFSLMFLPEICGLEFDVPLSAITDVARTRFMGRDAAIVALRDGRRFQLYPRHIDDFMSALRRF